MILFIRPSVHDAVAVKEILAIFGEATGLQTNLAKCSVTPIYGADHVLDEIVNILGCHVQHFPIRYLGLPLSTKKIPKPQVATMSRFTHGAKWSARVDQIGPQGGAHLLHDG
jgi:hypothetical protein